MVISTFCCSHWAWVTCVQAADSIGWGGWSLSNPPLVVPLKALAWITLLEAANSKVWVASSSSHPPLVVPGEAGSSRLNWGGWAWSAGGKATLGPSWVCWGSSNPSLVVPLEALLSGERKSLLLGNSGESHVVIVSGLEGHGAEAIVAVSVWHGFTSLIEGAVDGTISPVLVIAAFLGAIGDMEGTHISILTELGALSLGRDIGRSGDLILVEVAVSVNVPGSPLGRSRCGKKSSDDKFHFDLFKIIKKIQLISK